MRRNRLALLVTLTRVAHRSCPVRRLFAFGAGGGHAPPTAHGAPPPGPVAPPARGVGAGGALVVEPAQIVARRVLTCRAQLSVAESGSASSGASPDSPSGASADSPLRSSAGSPASRIVLTCPRRRDRSCLEALPVRRASPRGRVGAAAASGSSPGPRLRPGRRAEPGWRRRAGGTAPSGAGGTERESGPADEPAQPPGRTGCRRRRRAAGPRHRRPGKRRNPRSTRIGGFAQ